MPLDELKRLIMVLEEEMRDAARDLRFEYAARLRDEVADLKGTLSYVAAVVSAQRLLVLGRFEECDVACLVEARVAEVRRERQVAILVDLAQVSGRKPSISQHGARRRFVFEVAGHDICTADLDFTHLAGAGVRSIFAYDAQRVAGERTAAADETDRRCTSDDSRGERHRHV